MVSDLDPALLSFLAGLRWATADIAPLTQDASARRYFRLSQTTDKTAILMDASGAIPGEMARFLKIGRHLQDIGLSAPQVFAESADFLILEDFGDARLADLPSDQDALYRVALDAILHLQSHEAPAGLPICDSAHLAGLAATAWQWYPSEATGTPVATGDTAASLIADLARKVDLSPSCMMLRDFHAENVMWLPSRVGPARAGLLDFQDAMFGHPAFDVVSLLQDARRDIGPEFEHDMCAYFQKRSTLPDDEFAVSYAALGAIRNLRIIGMFARLSRLLQRPNYVDFLPRVWEYLTRDLAHPALSDLRKLVEDSLPPPTISHREFLKTACLTHPPQ